MPDREGSDAIQRHTRRKIPPNTEPRAPIWEEREGQKHVRKRKGAVLSARCPSGSTPSLPVTGTSPKPSFADTAATPQGGLLWERTYNLLGKGSYTKLMQSHPHKHFSTMQPPPQLPTRSRGAESIPPPERLPLEKPFAGIAAISHSAWVLQIRLSWQEQPWFGFPPDQPCLPTRQGAAVPAQAGAARPESRASALGKG